MSWYSESVELCVTGMGPYAARRHPLAYSLWVSQDRRARVFRVVLEVMSRMFTRYLLTVLPPPHPRRFVMPHLYRNTCTISKNKSLCSLFRVKFADVTNVTFPPIYEAFLSMIGVFSLDLGWILSVTCLASDVDFFDKLL